MARKKKATKTSEATGTALPVETTAFTPAVEPTALISESSEQDAGPLFGPHTIEAEQPERPVAAAGKSASSHAFAADPYPVLTVNLCGYSGGPTAHLQRRYGFKQFNQGIPLLPKADFNQVLERLLKWLPQPFMLDT